MPPIPVHSTTQEAATGCYADYKLPLHLRLPSGSPPQAAQTDAQEDLLTAVLNSGISFGQAAQISAAAGSTEPEAAGSFEAASPVPSLPESVADSTADEQVCMLLPTLVLAPPLTPTPTPTPI